MALTLAGAPISETGTELAGAQTHFLPKPGAVRFKRLLGSAVSEVVISC